MPKIQRLSQSLVNKIAAGEVIERPASVVKELMENAVDAGASRIDVAVEGGGAELVRVVDNGSGIPPEDLPLAVASHSTSKIASADDLFRVATLGFRGEALPSIAEVSQLVLRSRTPGGPSGAEIEVVGGSASPVSPCGCPAGTAVEVRNLFFNTPVRRKFLRSKQTEMGHTSEAFTRIALAWPGVHFTLQHNGRATFDLPAGQEWRERIALVVGRQLAGQLIRVESTDGRVRLSGYVAHPGQSRSNNRMQYLFLNGRFIRDRALQHALGEAYRGLLMTGRYPIAFLWLEMPPDLVDVNVHPTKLEVRFQDSGALYSQLLSTLRTKFLSTDLTARVESLPEEDPAGAHDEEQAARVRQQVVDWAKGEIASWDAPRADGPAGPGETSLPADAYGRPATPLELTRLDRPWVPAAEHEQEERDEPWHRADEPSPEPGIPPGAVPVKAMQVHNRYLVTETEEGVMVIDQHALHERILYEELRARVTSGAVESQNLLVPEPVDLSPAEAAAALEHGELLAQLGMKIEPFGGDTVLVASYPAMLANINPAEVLRGLVDRLLSGGKLPDRRDLLDDLLHTIACKAAIKAGDRLAPEEVHALLERRHLIDDPHHCPHGRPAAVIFSREELDRQFKRV
jgi:DNA mismatch repair protein MutL